MNNKSVFVRTSKGEDEIHGKNSHLHGDIRRALLMVDGQTSLTDITRRAAPSFRSILPELFVELLRSGFIQEKIKPHDEPVVKSSKPPQMAMPAGMVVPIKRPVQKLSNSSLDELDFTGVFRAPSPEDMAAEAAKADAVRLKQEQEVRKAREETEAKARKEIEAEKLKAQQLAEAARLKAEQEATKARDEAEAKARKELEVAKLKAQQEVEAARLKAEHHAREQAEAARLKAEQEAAEVRAELAAAQAKAEADARAHAEAEVKAKEAAEAKLREEKEAKAQAEAARLKAEQEAIKLREEAEQAKRQAAEEVAKAREEAERIKQQAAEAQAKIVAAEVRLRQEKEAKEQAEAARLKAEREAVEQKKQQEAKAREAEEAKARAEQEAAEQKKQQEAKAREAEEAKARAEQEVAEQKKQKEAKAREAEEVKARAEQEVAEQKKQKEAKAREAEEAKARAEQKAQQETRIKAEQEAAEQRAEQEAVRIKAEQDVSAREEIEREAAALARKTHDANGKRSTSATVLFFDVVGYTKQPVNKQIKIKKQFNQLVSASLDALGEDERIILDTGDGAAIGFLHHPEDALQVARQFREAVIGNRHKDYPELNVRTGIHLGPVNIVKDMNGQSNMVGDGINDAQRVMSFAEVDQILISRPYYDFISRLSDEYANLFQYRGVKQDKHGREHALYELVDFVATEEKPSVISTVAQSIKLEPFVFTAAVDVTAESSAVEGESSADIPQEAIPSQPDSMREAIKPETKSSPVEEKSAEPVAKKAVAEAHMPSEADVAAIAAAQAKVWSEAEQRAAKANEARADKAAEPEAKVEVPAVRARRKPIPWGKVSAGLVVLMIAALFVLPFILPMQERAANIERLLTAGLKQPVHIGNLSGRLLPTPRLELSEVTIGDAKQVRLESAQVDFAFSALFSATKPVNALGLKGLRVNGESLQQLPMWLQQLAGNVQYPVARVELNRAVLETDALKLSDIDGVLNFDAAGKFAKAILHADKNKFEMELNAVTEGKLKVAITVRNGALPMLPDWVFEDMRANGELTRDELIITDLDGSAMDGRLLGDARLSWSSGWQAKGNLIAKAITLQKVSPILRGDMDGSARFRMRADNAAKLIDSTSLEGSFVAQKGAINSFDLVDTARSHSKDSQPGGVTNFDELRGELAVDNGRYRFSGLKLNAGVLSASGSFDMEAQKLSGRITVNLSLRSGMGSVGLDVDGTSANPVLHAR